MKLTEMQVGKQYEIVGYGNLDANEIEELNKIGFIEGEIIDKGLDVNCVNSICMFNIENTMYSINVKYVEEIKIREI